MTGAAVRRCAAWAVTLAMASLLSLAPSAQAADALRVVDRVEGRAIPFDDLASGFADVDVLLVGGQPGQPATHRAEVRLFEALSAGRTTGALALEAFDRQAQDPLDHLQMGHLDDAAFLADVRRPWVEYVRDYKPTVDRAIAREWGVVAAGMPRPVAMAVAATGLATLDALAAGERSLVAATHDCGDVRHPGVEQLPGPYSNVALCLESETLAESIAQAHAAGALGGGKPLVIALVQEWRLGHLTRLAGDVMRRLPGHSVETLAIVVVPDVEAVAVARDDLAIPRLAVYIQP